MFTRIFVCKSLYKVSKNILVTQQHAAGVKYSIVHTQRCLHVKTYDKDAGMEKQRTDQFSDDKYAKNEDVGRKTQAHSIKSDRFSFEQSLCAQKSFQPVELGISQNKDVITAANDDPDVFGNASTDPVEDDKGDLEEEEYISRPTRHSKQLPTKAYATMIKDHLNNHRVKQALEVLDIRMLKEDRVKPDNYIYNLLISGCAKAGYTRQAFQLYNKMRQRSLNVKESTYTSLFNACANAPTRQDGLTRAIRLKQSLLEKGYEPNIKNYNAMIKTFGRWGDVKTAYILADEMRDKKLKMTAETFNFLLQACASDEKHGFRHCLLTWHKMLRKGIEPDYYSFSAVLRCVRDCGFGDLESMENVLQQILNKTQTKQIATKPLVDQISNCNEENNSNTNTEDNSVSLNLTNNENTLQIQTESTSLELPNLLAPQPHLGSMVSLSEVQKPHERFLLLGGLTGFLELMKSKRITPNIQTFTTMLEVIPPTNTAEKQLISYIRRIGLKADIDFFNILIKKRAMRLDYEGGKEVLSMIRTAGLHPDIVTFGVLALGCTTVESSAELLQQMRNNGIRMNIQILGAMLRQGCFQRTFPYICEIMQISLDENMKPNDVFLRNLHNFYMQCARAIDARHPTTKTKSYKQGHMKFCNKYRLYEEEHGIGGLKLEDAIKKIKERPYAQYKENEVEGLEALKNEKLSRKNKMRKYIKKIKIQYLKGDELQNDTEPIAVPNNSDDNVVVKSNFEEVIQNEQKQNNPFRIT